VVEVKKEETKEPVIKEKEEKEKPLKVEKKETIDITTLNLTELKEQAKLKGIKGYSKLKKEELLEILK
ncbi:MAG: Rho termination factor N-terminal domain-containing protein, partial [Bacilli bacterium]